jgi:NTE family protein
MDGKKVFSYFDVVLPRSGILNGTKRLKELFSFHTDAEDFSELKIPVMMVATDLITGKKVVLKSGNIMNTQKQVLQAKSMNCSIENHLLRILSKPL